MNDVLFNLAAPAMKGFLTMASLIVAIGVQNAFVLRQGTQKQGGYVAAAICSLCDIVLVTLGAAGLGALVAGNRWLGFCIALVGAIFLSFYGVRSLRAAKAAKGLDLSAAKKTSPTGVVVTALAVSLLNPHALLDTIVLVGGLAARYESAARVACVIGAVTASIAWFFSLAYGAGRLAPVLSQPKVWRIIDLVIGVMMLTLAISLYRDAYGLLMAAG